MDWTDFKADDHTTLVVSLVTEHGGSTPLVWLTVHKSLLRRMRNEAEDAVLVCLREGIPSAAKVTVLADRGFADHMVPCAPTEIGSKLPQPGGV
jgi:hypothetical protein